MDLDELNNKWKCISDEIRDSYEQMEVLRLKLHDLKVNKNKIITKSRNLYKEALAAGYKFNNVTKSFEE